MARRIIESKYVHISDCVIDLSVTIINYYCIDLMT
jgi:hypothetical protein